MLDNYTGRSVALANRKFKSLELLQKWWEKCTPATYVASSSTVRYRCLQFCLRGCKARRRHLMTTGGDLEGLGTVPQQKLKWGRPMHPSPQYFEKYCENYCYWMRGK